MHEAEFLRRITGEDRRGFPKELNRLGLCSDKFTGRVKAFTGEFHAMLRLHVR